MANFTNRNQISATSASYDAGLRSYMLQVYNYMAGALALSGLVAYLAASTPGVMQAIYGTPLQFVVMLAPLGIMIYLQARLNSMSYSAAQTAFWIFAGAMGLSLSYIFIAYTGHSIARTFFVTASVFGAMSLYGYTTKRDLTSFGAFFFMGLIGVILASVVNIFLKSAALEFAISIAGVLIFVGLTAYDTQRIKTMYYQAGDVGKAAIMGALSLYLDFINLFTMLLRLTGDRR